MTPGGVPDAGPATGLLEASPPAAPPDAGPLVAGPPAVPPGSVPPAEPEPVYTSGPLRWRRAVLRHHHRGEYRVGTLLGAALLLIVVVAASGWVTAAERGADHRFREFVVTAELGQPVRVGEFEATLLEARPVARVAERPDDDEGSDTGGVWVAVLLRLEAVDQPAAMGYAAVTDRGGRSWVESERVEQPLVGYQLQPGIPVLGRVAFEVPRGAATGLTLRIGERDPELNPIAEIALPIDDATVTEGLADARPLLLDAPEVVPADLGPAPAGGGGP